MASSFKASRPGLPGRILMTSDTMGDVWDYSIGLSTGLARLGIQIDLATIGPPLTEERRGRARAIPNLRLYEQPDPVVRGRALWLDNGPSTDWLLHLEKAGRPDLVHANSLLHGAVPWRSPYLVAAHRCLISWWNAVGDEITPRNWGGHRGRVTQGLRNASLVVAATDAAAANLQEQYDRSLAVRVIGYGHDYRAIEEPKKDCIIAAADCWDEANNLEILEVAAPYLTWPMFMAGRWLDAAGKQQLPRNIFCLGPLPEVELDSWLARSSIFVMPARYSTCPMSILRAATAGCALVLGALPEVRETWQGAALFVPPGDRLAVRAAFDKLINDPARRRDMQIRARERAASFKVSAMVSGYLTAYQDALGSAALRNLTSESLVGA